jgi:type III pantothenate kinase
MQLIAADIGNSSIKVAIEHAADDDRWCLETIFRGDEPLDLDLTDLDVGDEPAFWSVSSVNQGRQKRLQNWIQQHRPEDQFHVIESDDIDLKSDVESRVELGRDRLIGAWMAIQLNDQRGPIVVIDAGTAVTIDLVDRNLVFQGGVIFPGAESNFRRLADYTHALPNLGRGNQPDASRGPFSDVIGKSTNDAILKGVYQSQISAIRGIAKQMATRSVRRATIFATGGGITDIAGDLPQSWDLVPDLVLRGARSIGRSLLSRNGKCD